MLRAPPASNLTLRTEIRSRYLEVTGHSKMDGRQAAHMEAVIRLLARLEAREGYGIHRTWRQLSRGLGWAEKGMTVAEVHNRFKTQLHNTLGYLERIGWIDGWEPIVEGREHTGVMIRVPAGVAQLVRATGYSATRERRPRCSYKASQTPQNDPVPVGDPGPDQPFLSGEDCTPLKGLGGNTPTSGIQREKRGGCARATASRLPEPTAALQTWRETVDRGGGRAILADLPWLADVSAAVSARAACRVWMPSLRDLRLSAQWEARLNTAVEQLDRLDGRGAGVAAILDLVAEDEGGRPDPLFLDLLRGQKPRRDKDPRTLGAVAVVVHRWARRRVAEARRGERPRVSREAARA